jgi:hypothetical protein
MPRAPLAPRVQDRRIAGAHHAGRREAAAAQREDDLVELLIARNPALDSRLPYLLHLPPGGGVVFRTTGTWPRTTALYCHSMPLDDSPAAPDIVERVPLRSCTRRGPPSTSSSNRGDLLQDAAAPHPRVHEAVIHPPGGVSAVRRFAEPRPPNIQGGPDVS